MLLKGRISCAKLNFDFGVRFVVVILVVQFVSAPNPSNGPFERANFSVFAPSVRFEPFEYCQILCNKRALRELYHHGADLWEYNCHGAKDKASTVLKYRSNIDGGKRLCAANSNLLYCMVAMDTPTYM